MWDIPTGTSSVLKKKNQVKSPSPESRTPNSVRICQSGRTGNRGVTKSTTAELLIAHLSEAFQILREYNMKLNPAKCVFGVSAGKFLGFIVNNRGIEANPDKIKAVLDMPPPSNIKEVQRPTGRIAALSRFVFKASDKCQPFFQVLKKAFQWDTSCEEAFLAPKTYLSSPPILVSPS